MIFLFQGCIPRFHVNLPRCIYQFQGLLANFMANFIASNRPVTVTPSMVVIGSETPPRKSLKNSQVLNLYKVWLVGGFKYFLFSSILGEDSHFDDHIFQRGWNHQPVIFPEREVTTIYGKLPLDLEDVKGRGFFFQKNRQNWGRKGHGHGFFSVRV